VNLYTTMPDLPSELDGVPGTKTFNDGRSWRVPNNTLPLLGGVSPRLTVQAARDAVAELPLLSPDARNRMTPHQLMLIGGALRAVAHHFWAPAGSGKTLAALAANAQHASQGPLVVVCPAGVVPGWERQILRWTLMDPRPLSGQTPHPLSREKGAVYIVGWEVLKFWAREIIKLRPVALLLDETHMLRRPKHVRAIQQRDGTVKFESLENTLAAAIAVSNKAQRRYSLTASPIPGRVADLWVQLNLVEPWQWGSFFTFAQRYAGATHNGYGWEYKGVSCAEELRARLAAVRTYISLSETHKHLPPKRREVVRLPLNQQDKPMGMKRELRSAARSGDPLTFLEALLMEAASRKETATKKRVVAAMLSGQKVVVFTARRKHCEHLAETIKKALGRHCPRADVFWGHGEQEVSAREKTRQEYMAHPGPCVLVGTGDAWGVGIDLQDTDLCLMVMLPWTPDKVIQWEGRFHRLGQTRPVLISYIICDGTADEQVADTVVEKLEDIVEVQEEAELSHVQDALTGIDTSPEGRIALLQRISQRQL